MSSYNNIRKIKYTKIPSDVVSLHEYIMFEDARAKRKYVVFKFSNNVNQRLFEIKFEVSQFNENNELIEKSVVSHADFIAEANDLFVPNAKLAVNFDCVSLEVRLEEASFDRVVWRNGEFIDNSYRFDDYAEKASKKDKPPAVETESRKKDKKQAKNKRKAGFTVTDVFHKNRAVFPAVFNVALSVVLVAFAVASAFYFKAVTGAFVVDNFVVKESTAGYVTILSYEGEDTNIEIPATLNERYAVTKIARGAFAGSAVQGIEIKTSFALTIETGAFANCPDLVAVASADINCGAVVLMEGAFTNCNKLQSFEVGTARLSRKCFDGTNSIKTLSFDYVLYDAYKDGARLIEIFNGLESISLEYSCKVGYPAEFFEGIN